MHIQCIFAVLKSRWINLMPLLAKSLVPGFGQLGSKFRLSGVVQKGFDSSCKPKFYTHADKDPVLCIFQQKKRKEYTTTLVKRLWLSRISKLIEILFEKILFELFPILLSYYTQTHVSLLFASPWPILYKFISCVELFSRLFYSIT